MNYSFMRDVLRVFEGSMSLDDFIVSLMSRYSSLQVIKALSLYNLLGSHDTPRIKTLVKDVVRLEAAYALLFSITGSPSIYYGDEIGMEGCGDPDNRRGMIWDKSLWNHALQTLIKDLASIRRLCPPLRQGLMRVSRDGDLLLVRRYLNNSSSLTIINMSEHVISTPKTLDGLDPLTSRRVETSEDYCVFKDYGFIIYC